MSNSVKQPIKEMEAALNNWGKEEGITLIRKLEDFRRLEAIRCKIQEYVRHKRQSLLNTLGSQDHLDHNKTEERLAEEALKEAVRMSRGRKMNEV